MAGMFHWVDIWVGWEVEVMKIRIRSVCSIFCLLVVTGVYLMSYMYPHEVNEEVSLFIGKIGLLEELLKSREKVESLKDLLRPRVTGGTEVGDVYKEFTSLDELIIFLSSDGTNELVYSSNFVCHHFSETLIRNAREEKYRLEYLGLYGKDLKAYCDDYVLYMEKLGYVSWWGTGEGHAVCTVSIVDRVFVIESQTDVILERVDGRYVGVYRGEV